MSGNSIYLPLEHPIATKYKKVVMKFEDIPSTKIADLNRGVLMPISQEIGDFKLKIELDISDEEGILKSTIENKIRETIAQIGGKIVKEDLE